MDTKADKYSELFGIFKGKTDWHMARVKCLVAIVCAMCKLQTISFVKLAQGFDGSAMYESNHRRIQRFFAEMTIDRMMLARLIFSLLPHKPPYRLALDRTNWQFGKRDINILMLCVCYHGVALPLLWVMLDKRGNSDQQERAALMNDYLSLFGADTVSGFMADREFIGTDWFGKLIRNAVPFHIRIRENMEVNVPRKGIKKAFWLFNDLKLGECRHYRGLVYIGGNLVYLSGMKVVNRKTAKIEFLIIASFNRQDQALVDYKERWQIETMFKAMKSSGFNMEDSHLSDLERISTMVGVISIAFIWAYLAGIDKHEHCKAIEVKKHGRKAYSFFKYGLIRIAHAILNTMDCRELGRCINLLSCT